LPEPARRHRNTQQPREGRWRPRITAASNWLHSIPDVGITRPAIGLVQGASWQVSKRRNTFGSTDTSDGVGSQDYGVSPTTGVKLRGLEGAQ
jgi:hypothetical protein